MNGKTASSSATMEDRTPAESFSKEFYLGFLREVNHKLSQPATSLRFCLEFALQENGEKLKHSVQHALSLTETLIDLLNAMRELTEAQDAGDVQESIDFAEASKAALAASGLPAGRFLWDSGFDKALRVRAHAGRLQRAFTNLLTEAALDALSTRPVVLEMEENRDRVSLCCVYEAGEQSRNAERFFLPFAERGSKLDARALVVAISKYTAEACGGAMELVLNGKWRELRLSLAVEPGSSGEPSGALFTAAPGQ